MYELARKGSKSNFAGPEPAIGLAYRTQRKVIRDNFTLRHNKMWEQLNNCRHSKHFIVGTNMKTTKYLLNQSRKELRTQIGFITGHCKLNKHLHRMGLSTDSSCKKCHEQEETPIHLLTTCPAPETARKVHFGTANISEQDVSSKNIKKIMNFYKNYIEENEDSSLYHKVTQQIGT